MFLDMVLDTALDSRSCVSMVSDLMPMMLSYRRRATISTYELLPEK
jgi:hypothetical protein